MGVSKNRGIQHGWFIMENPMNKWDDLGVFFYFRKHSHPHVVSVFGVVIREAGPPKVFASPAGPVLF